jgi:hypothetical protein
MRSGSQKPSRLLRRNGAKGAGPILVITPANLRKQWPREMEEKFILSTVILEAKNHNELAKSGDRHAFEQKSLAIARTSLPPATLTS